MRRWLTFAISALLVSAGSAEAQTRSPSPSPGGAPAPRLELGLRATWLGGHSFGSASADLLTSTGGTLPLFIIDKSIGPTIGMETTLGVRVTTRLSAEVSGRWSQAEFRGQVHDDFEGAAATTLTESLTRFAAGGAAVWTIRAAGRTAWFVRGGGAWMREVFGTNELVADGVIVNVGAGMKYWWRNRPGALRIGLRIEGGAEAQKRGVRFDDRTLHVVPAFSGGAVFGF